MKLGHNYLFCKDFGTVYFKYKEKNAVTLPHSTQQRNEFWGKIKKMSKTKKLAPREKITLELLHQRFGHKYTGLFLAAGIANVW